MPVSADNVAHKSAPRPRWLKVRLPAGADYEDVRALVGDLQLHTVCQSARCPNLGECWNQRTATFMLMGEACTRSCGFCAVRSEQPGPLDAGEPERVAQAVSRLKLRYAVLTSVTRDDLPDGGAAHFAATIRTVRAHRPDCQVEVLIPDFQGDARALATVVAEHPDVLNHNVETVPRLYSDVRPQAAYDRSLELLRRAKELNLEQRTKSGIMVGIGESLDEVHATMRDLRGVGCDILTIGQYLRPSLLHLPVARYYEPAEFEALRTFGGEIGFLHVEAGPLVRSSYHAAEQRSALMSADAAQSAIWNPQL